MNVRKLEQLIKYKDIFDEYGTNPAKLVKNVKLPETFIDDYFYQLKPYRLEQHQKLSEYLLTKYADNLNWYSLSIYQCNSLTEKMIDAHLTEVDFGQIAAEYKLTEKQFIKWFNYFKTEKLLYCIEINPHKLFTNERFREILERLTNEY